MFFGILDLILQTENQTRNTESQYSDPTRISPKRPTPYGRRHQFLRRGRTPRKGHRRLRLLLGAYRATEFLGLGLYKGRV